ncbi:hypothetical protein XCR_3989 [Xanthomonas campestris pv. raphani 756C]|nr:hypothetical protein XCR_3989 [Xanthomonas campestris pv. raphani 756C]
MLSGERLTRHVYAPNRATGFIAWSASRAWPCVSTAWRTTCASRLRAELRDRLHRMKRVACAAMRQYCVANHLRVTPARRTA